MKIKCNPAPFNPEGNTLNFICGKCEEGLEIKIVTTTDHDPIQFGTRTYKEAVPYCPKCDIISDINL